MGVNCFFAVRGVAERINADDLFVACEAYQEKNHEFIQKVRQSQYAQT